MTARVGSLSIWFGIALAAVLGPVSAHAEGQVELLQLERRVATDYPRVRSLIPQQVEQMVRDGRELLVLDVREAAEFEVSHLPGAVRVDPGMGAAQFETEFGTRLAGRPVLVYCSVGVRSSRLAERIEPAALKAGASGVFNLRGGIFAWHNYGLELRRGNAQTQFVHPYSRSWSRYLDFPDLARYQSPVR